jgi:thiamine biosynthesis protein ThiI
MENNNLVLFLIRYNELGLKSPKVRTRFQNQMIKNIENKFLDAKLDCFIDSDWGRIYSTTEDKAQGLKMLRTVFGISSISPVLKYSDALDEITDAAVEYAKKLLKPNQSFALRTRRTGQHKFTSQDVAVHVGDAILSKLKDKNLSVNLTKPDVEIFIEVRMKSSFIFSETFSGPGGLPLGTQGKVISIFTDENSYIASWLMMKRGCRTYPVIFKAKNDEAQPFPEELNKQLEALKPWATNIKPLTVDIDTSSLSDGVKFDLDNKELLFLIEKFNVKGICLSIGLDDFSKVNVPSKNELPVFYPLIGLDDEKINSLKDIINEF